MGDKIRRFGSAPPLPRQNKTHRVFDAKKPLVLHKAIEFAIKNG